MSDQIAHKVSVAITVEWILKQAGALQTGKSGTTTATVFDEADVSFATPTVTEPITGIYRCSFTPDAAGLWHVKIVESSLPEAIVMSYRVVAVVDSEELDDIQARLPAALVSGRMDSSVGAMAAGVVTAAAIATDAIDADALATNAVDEIVDQVWNELIAGHLGAGSTGEALNNAAAGGTPATIADAVWDEARAGHVAAGSFGEGVASVQGNVTGSVGSVTGNVGGNVVGSVGSVAAGGIAAASFAAGAIDAAAIATDAIGSAELAASAITEIQAGLATAAALATVQADTDDIQTRLPAALVGGRMDSSVGAMAAGVVTAAAVGTGAIDADALATDAVNEIADQVWEEAIADHSGTVGSTAEALAAAATGGSAPSAAVIADAVWDEARAGHVAAGSFGEGVASVQGNVTGSVASVAAGGITAASIATGAVDADALAADAVGEIADGVWDEALAGHLAAGSTGEALNNAGSGASAAAIADAVWDEALADHVAAGSMGANQNLIDNVPADTDALVTASHGAGSYVEVAAPTAAAIADAVWEEQIGDHSGTVGSTAEALDNVAAGASPAQIADAVWDEVLAGHLTAGSTGEALNDAANCAGGGGSDIINVEGV